MTTKPRVQAGGGRQELLQLTAADSLLPPLDLNRPPFAVLGKCIYLGLTVW